MGLEDLVPLYGERSTKDKVDEVFGYLDKKLSLQFFISMFLVEAVKNYVGGNYYVATRMVVAAVLIFVVFVVYMEYWDSVKEKAKEVAEEK